MAWRTKVSATGPASPSMRGSSACVGRHLDARHRRRLRRAAAAGDRTDGGGRHHDAELRRRIEHVLLGEIDEAIKTALRGGESLDIDLPPGVRAEVLGFGAATGGRAVPRSSGRWRRGVRGPSPSGCFVRRGARRCSGVSPPRGRALLGHRADVRLSRATMKLCFARGRDERGRDSCDVEVAILSPGPGTATSCGACLGA